MIPYTDCTWLKKQLCRKQSSDTERWGYNHNNSFPISVKSQKKKLESTAFIEELPISHWYQRPVMFGKEMTYCCTAKVAGADGMWATFPITDLPRSQNRKHKGTPVQMVLRTLIQLLPGHLQILKALHSIWHAKRYEIRPPTQMRCQITTVIYFLFPPHTNQIL